MPLWWNAGRGGLALLFFLHSVFLIRVHTPEKGVRVVKVGSNRSQTAYVQAGAIKWIYRCHKMAAFLPRTPSSLVLHFADIKCCKFRPPPLFLSPFLSPRGGKKRKKRDEGKNFGRKTLAVLNPRFATDKFAWKCGKWGKLTGMEEGERSVSNYSKRISSDSWLKGRKILHPL